MPSPTPRCSGSCIEQVHRLAFGRFADFSISGVAGDADGNKYIVGTHEEGFHVDESFIEGTTEVDRGFLLKISDTLEWSYIVDGARAMALTTMTVGPSGNVLVGGLADYDTGFVGGESTAISLYLAKVAPDGTEIWSRRYPINAEPSNWVTDSFRALAEGEDGSIFAVGDNRDAGGAFLSRLSPDGNLEWTHEFPGAATIAQVLHDGSAVYVAFTQHELLTTCKFDAAGEQLWSTTNGAGSAIGLLSGPESSIVVFADQDGRSRELRLDTVTGDELGSSELIDGANLRHVARDPSGGYVLSGTTTGSRFSAFGSEEVLAPLRSGVSSMFLVAITADHEGRWSFVAGEGNSDTYNSGIWVAPNGHVFTAGRVHRSTSTPILDVRGTVISAPRLGYGIVLNPSEYQ